MQAVLLGCTYGKLFDGIGPVMRLYGGNQWRFARKDKTPGRKYYAVSTSLGIIESDEIVHSYEQPFDPEVLVHKISETTYKLIGIDEVVVCAASKYTNAIKAAIPNNSFIFILHHTSPALRYQAFIDKMYNGNPPETYKVRKGNALATVTFQRTTLTIEDALERLDQMLLRDHSDGRHKYKEYNGWYITHKGERIGCRYAVSYIFQMKVGDFSTGEITGPLNRMGFDCERS